MRRVTASDFSEALRDSAPVLFGYIPLGMAFGVLFQSLGHHWIFAPLAGLLIYAGSAQFMAVGLLAAGASYAEAFISTLVLNSRHIFYGLSVMSRYPAHGLSRWYLIFGLTDETYSLITARPPQSPGTVRYYVFLTGLNQSYWVIGCALGASLQSLYAFDSRGFEFALVALFLVLLIDQVRTMDERWLLAVALSASVLAYLLIPNQFLLVAIGMCLVTLFVRVCTGGEHG
ncbi:MAG: AzlC family ABC transporter permease [Pseudomonadota bacterium]|nr:AzlC family ABC transporter permease [Pseudomonadota bacterium]